MASQIREQWKHFYFLLWCTHLWRPLVVFVSFRGFLDFSPFAIVCTVLVMGNHRYIELVCNRMPPKKRKLDVLRPPSSLDLAFVPFVGGLPTYDSFDHSKKNKSFHSARVTEQLREPRVCGQRAMLEQSNHGLFGKSRGSLDIVAVTAISCASHFALSSAPAWSNPFNRRPE